MSEPLVSIENLTVEYESEGYAVRPLDNFSMSIDRGEFLAILGPSGSGKTTLLSALSGIVKATSGVVIVDGVDVLGLKGRALEQYRRNTIGIVFQGFNLLPSLTAAQNVAAPLLMGRVDRKTALSKAHQLLDEVDLLDRAHHLPRELSGGQQQRVAVARGLIGDPALLLADEPTANLDVISAESVVSLLLRLRDAGRSILLSTHDNRLLPAVDRSLEMGGASTSDSDSAGGSTELEPGETLFLQGDPSDFVYFVERGEVEVVRELANGRSEILTHVRPGTYVGELGPLLGFPRSATVRASKPSTLAALTVAEFKDRNVRAVAKVDDRSDT